MIIAVSWLAGRALKEGRAPLAPALRRLCIYTLEAEQGAGQKLRRQAIRTASNDQLAKLSDPPLSELASLVVERLQFGIIVAGLAHHVLLVDRGGQSSYRVARSVATRRNFVGQNSPEKDEII
jgi:hypothetical protein